MIFCPCGNTFPARQHLERHGPRQAPDHPELMQMYGDSRSRPEEFEMALTRTTTFSRNADIPTKAPDAGSIRVEHGNAASKPSVHPTAGQTAEPAQYTRGAVTSINEASPSSGGPRSSTPSDTDSEPPTSPSEIKVSTLELISLQHGIDAEQCAREQPSAPEAKEIMEIADQEWPLNEIVDAKIVDNERRLRVRWADSYIHPRYLHRRADGMQYVLIGAQQWEVEHCEEIPTDDNDLRLCIVRWMPTWMPELELRNARGLIDAFDEQARLKAIDRQLNPVKDESPVPELAITQGSRDVQWMGQGEVDEVPYGISGLRFDPQLDREYSGEEFREVLARELKDLRPPYSLWQPEMDQRRLTFRPAYVNRGNPFDLVRREKRRAVMDYICGIEQERQCAHCEGGAGPFPKCVVASNSLNGACANCACSSSAKRCNFHGESESTYSPYSAKLTAVAVHEHWEASRRQLLTPPASSPLTEGVIDIVDDIEYDDDESLSHAERPVDQHRRSSNASANENSERANLSDLTDQELSVVEQTNTARPGQRLSGHSQRSVANGRNGSPIAGDAAGDVSSMRPPLHPSQPSKRPRPSNEERSSFREVENGTSLPLRPAKSPRVSGDPVSSVVRQAQASFCNSSALAIWREDSYRHPGCSQDLEAPCTEFAWSTDFNMSNRSIRQAADRISSGNPFGRSEASHAEVQYILRRCPCTFTQSFRESWEDWTHHTAVGVSQEEFISQFYCYRLNEAMQRFCGDAGEESFSEYEIVRMDGKDIIVID